MKKTILLLALLYTHLACEDIDILSPIVETREASQITPNQAQLNGELVVTGTELIITIGFQYDTDSLKVAQGGLPIVSTLDFRANEPGPFSATVTGLTENTKYYFRAVAETSDLIASGEIKSFTTAE